MFFSNIQPVSFAAVMDAVATMFGPAANLPLRVAGKVLPTFAHACAMALDPWAFVEAAVEAGNARIDDQEDGYVFVAFFDHSKAGFENTDPRKIFTITATWDSSGGDWRAPVLFEPGSAKSG